MRYKIVRMYQEAGVPSRVIKRGLSLEEAQDKFNQIQDMLEGAGL